MRLVERHQELGRELRVLGAVFLLGVGEDDEEEEHQVGGPAGVTSHFPEIQGDGGSLWILKLGDSPFPGFSCLGFPVSCPWGRAVPGHP